MRWGVYIDFDNLYGSCLEYLNIKPRDKISECKIIFLKCFIEILFKNLWKRLSVDDNVVAYMKAFSEYESLPFSKNFEASIPVFLHNVGVKPINPFVKYNRNSKNKNASDISLALEVVTDLVVKKVPVDAVVIISGDVDFYPLASWIRENTNKDVYIASHTNRASSMYTSMLEYFTKMDSLYSKSLHACVEKLQKGQLCIKTSLDNSFWEWIKSLVLKRIPDEISFIELQILDIDSANTQDPAKSKCEKFTEKLIEGLKYWLKKKDYATTGLIFRNWLPKWDIGMDEKEANECLKNILNLLKEHCIEFIMEQECEGLIIGKFVKTC